jgi:hypothetical protein
MRLPLSAAAACAALTFGVAAAGAHELDHAPPAFVLPAVPPSPQFIAGGTNAKWELIRTIATGNPHSDIDFFKHKGETYLSAGTLGVGPNAGGQTIVQLTSDGQVSPRLVGNHPSAACASATTSATGLQHDVEATPKGGTLLNDRESFARGGDAELLIDATDASGRCHDNGTLGASGAPAGGLEIIDVTDPSRPVELALIRATGNAHTVNVDPKRPHIAFIVTQDGVGVDGNGKRSNETSGNGLDGFEIVDLSSCMGFPEGTSVDVKRATCRPEVYRYRYPSPRVAQSHTFPRLQSCHELEVYADDRITCASITATAIFDMSKAFDGRGRPKGDPLPCATVDSSSATGGTKAKVQDCATGLNVSQWLAKGAPSIKGIDWVGTVPHMGFNSTEDIAVTKYDATEDLVAAHESEFTQSRRFVITSDERGGGVVPPGSACGTGANDAAKMTNGGLHFFPTSAFTQDPPRTAEDAWKLWARQPGGEKAVWRATPRAARTLSNNCTAHVFQQIPGQNRIFMGWYNQGTQVLDFIENRDGTVTFREAGWFIPEFANTWTSAIFKMEENADGSWTYWGATGDGILPGTGRSAIDVYKVTLPRPPLPAPAKKR